MDMPDSFSLQMEEKPQKYSSKAVQGFGEDYEHQEELDEIYEEDYGAEEAAEEMNFRATGHSGFNNLDIIHENPDDEIDASGASKSKSKSEKETPPTKESKSSKARALEAKESASSLAFKSTKEEDKKKVTKKVASKTQEDKKKKPLKVKNKDPSTLMKVELS